MIDSGEVAADIGLESVAHFPSHDLPPKGLQGVVTVATRSKTETAVKEVGFEHSFEYARDRSPQQSVRDSGISQRSRAALAGPLGISTRRTGGARYMPAFTCLKISSIRSSISLANWSPATVLVPRQLLRQPKSVRMAGSAPVVRSLKIPVT
jgi:hypothetical protein